MAERLRRAAWLAPAVLAVGLLAGCGGTDDPAGVVSGMSVHDEDGMNGAVLTQPYRTPAATLTDTAGDRYPVREELRSADRPLTLVFFGYTHCPDICQAVMADVTSALTRLEPAEAAQVGMVYVTSDPGRDTAPVLREYLDRFNPDFEGLTGPLPDIVSFAEGLHVPIEKGPRLPSGGYEITHGTAVLGVTPDGRVPILWTEGTSSAKLAADFHQILTDGIPETGQEG